MLKRVQHDGRLGDWRWGRTGRACTNKFRMTSISETVRSELRGGSGEGAMASPHPQNPAYFSVLMYAITSLRAAGSDIPAKVILVPGTFFIGAVRYSSSVASSQVRPAFFIASLKT